jgi:hypothetical protein
LFYSPSSCRTPDQSGAPQITTFNHFYTQV